MSEREVSSAIQYLVELPAAEADGYANPYDIGQAVNEILPSSERGIQWVNSPKREKWPMANLRFNTASTSLDELPLAERKVDFLVGQVVRGYAATTGLDYARARHTTTDYVKCGDGTYKLDALTYSQQYVMKKGTYEHPLFKRYVIPFLVCRGVVFGGGRIDYEEPGAIRTTQGMQLIATHNMLYASKGSVEDRVTLIDNSADRVLFPHVLRRLAHMTGSIIDMAEAGLVIEKNETSMPDPTMAAEVWDYNPDVCMVMGGGRRMRAIDVFEEYLESYERHVAKGRLEASDSRQSQTIETRRVVDTYRRSRLQSKKPDDKVLESDIVRIALKRFENRRIENAKRRGMDDDGLQKEREQVDTLFHMHAEPNDQGILPAEAYGMRLRERLLPRYYKDEQRMRRYVHPFERSTA